MWLARKMCVPAMRTKRVHEPLRQRAPGWLWVIELEAHSSASTEAGPIGSMTGVVRIERKRQPTFPATLLRPLVYGSKVLLKRQVDVDGLQVD